MGADMRPLLVSDDVDMLGRGGRGREEVGAGTGLDEGGGGRGREDEGRVGMTRTLPGRFAGAGGWGATASLGGLWTLGVGLGLTAGADDSSVLVDNSSLDWQRGMGAGVGLSLIKLDSDRAGARGLGRAIVPCVGLPPSGTPCEGPPTSGPPCAPPISRCIRSCASSILLAWLWWVT